MSDTEFLPKSNAQAVRRLEVFTGTGRRRSWNAEEKERIVAESHTCGDSVSAVARRHGLTPQQLFAWRRHVRHSVEGEAGAPTLAPVLHLLHRYGNRLAAVWEEPTNRDRRGMGWDCRLADVRLEHNENYSKDIKARHNQAADAVPMTR